MSPDDTAVLPRPGRRYRPAPGIHRAPVPRRRHLVQAAVVLAAAGAVAAGIALSIPLAVLAYAYLPLP